MLEFIRPFPDSILNILNSFGLLSLIYLTRLRVDLNYFRENKLPHNFRESKKKQIVTKAMNRLSITFSFCLNFKNESKSLLQNIRIVNPNLLSMNKDVLTHLSLCGYNVLTDNTNTLLLNSVIEYIT